MNGILFNSSLLHSVAEIGQLAPDSLVFVAKHLLQLIDLLRDQILLPGCVEVVANGRKPQNNDEKRY
jgi:hypothetical protein